MAISSWSTTAADNDGLGIADEGQTPNTVNDGVRTLMADVRTDRNSIEWRDWGHTPTRTSNTQFTLPSGDGDQTAVYAVGRRLKCTDSSTLYGVITSSDYNVTTASQTTVNVTLDSGSLSASLSAVALGFDPTNSPYASSIQDTSNSASGNTSSAFTSIPSWVTKITISVANLSTSGTSIPLIQIGDSGGYETSGYVGTAATIVSTGTTSANISNGFAFVPSWGASTVAHGVYKLTLLDFSTNLWVCEGGVGYSNTDGLSTTRGSKTLSATLDRVRIIMANGTDTFDGSTIINVNYGR